MLPELGAILVIIVVHGGHRHRLSNLYTWLGHMALRGLIFLALLFARMIGGFFYLLLITFFDFPSWILSFFSTPHSPSCLERQREQNLRRKRSNIPEGWVRISICDTSNISHLDIVEGHGRHSTEDPEAPRGPWEERELFSVTKEEVKRRVMPWLDQIIEEEDPDSGCHSDAGVAEGSMLERELSSSSSEARDLADPSIHLSVVEDSKSSQLDK